jgi:glyoxylase-like metal-dependent hydrolase (beta-lactamase superfamily II)
MSLGVQGANEVGDGLWAYLQLEPGWGWSNAGLVTDGDASLLVDTLFDLHLTARMLESLRSVAPAAESIGTVVNTHANGDHCYGNQLVRDADIVTSSASAREMDEVPPALMAGLLAGADGLGATGAFLQKIFGGFDFEGIEHIPATTTFDGSLTLHVGDRTVELIELGPAHTAGDVIVHVPDAGVLFAGDLVFHKIQPVIWAGPVQRWIDACDRMLALEPTVVVPGHGPLSDTACVREQRDYLTWLVAEATPRLQGGLSVMDTARELMSLGDHGSEGERLMVNVTAVARDLGHEVDAGVLTLFGGMAELAAG